MRVMRLLLKGKRRVAFGYEATSESLGFVGCQAYLSTLVSLLSI